MKSRYKICVSGAAALTPCSANAAEMAKEVGREIARQKMVLLTGATTGIPHYAALGCKEENGFSIGFSPAGSEKEHLKTYRLPLDYYDLVIYTGFDYAGRNLILTRSSDGVIIICGRIGTLNEFTSAFEYQKPIGVLEGSGGNADMIRKILAKGHRGKKNVIFDRDPRRLVRRLIRLITKIKENYYNR